MDLSIIIVNWHSVAHIRACLRTLVEQTRRVRYEVIVIDNASFDGCGETLASEHPGVRFLQSPANVGFAGANNLAAATAQSATLLFLNPDTEILDGAVDRLFQIFQTLPDVGILGCRLLNTDGTLQTSCVQSFPTVLNQVLDAEILRHWFPRADLWGTAVFREDGLLPTAVEAVSGACMMIRAATFQRVGGFSRDYFMYGEDLDLCWKLRRIGLRNYHYRHAVITHHGGGSSRSAPSGFSTVMMRHSVATLVGISQGPQARQRYRVAMALSSAGRLGLLLLSFPIWPITGRMAAWRGATRKWTAILQWALGLRAQLVPGGTAGAGSGGTGY